MRFYRRALTADELSRAHQAAVPESRDTILEGEYLEVIKKSGGVVEKQIMHEFGGSWRGGAQLWWHGQRLRDTLELALPIQGAGDYELRVQMTKACDYLIVLLRLDGSKIGEPVDLYNPPPLGRTDVATTGELSFGTHHLEPGVHNLTVDVTGKNPKALDRGNNFGIDYLRLIRRP